ncbi:hypothetical protein E3N88_19240 [Mikania micrantha]|uniref:Uncharacterized protein n=1 Tax=Mikania micrantha TaxID=192012 RepID=A0A5N6NN61_9ASTR|nr:hypothetical protein E3N88_19240 [Mikania micrantha]
MNPSKVEECLFDHHLDPIGEPHQSITNHQNPHEEHPQATEFCLPPFPEFDLFRSSDEDSGSHTSSDAEPVPPETNPRPQIINPKPHVSFQFYTFNFQSHSLMIRCILDRRLANPDEIRACVESCPVCSGSNGPGLGHSKRRRFEYTESFDVPAKDVANKLQQLAAKHKIHLPRNLVLKREPYASKRRGCGFRIRAIVPICNYNEKDKTFVYQEEGMAVFKLYAVHTGHEPGPLDGNARIVHRVVGHKGGFLIDQDFVCGTSDEADNENIMGNDDGDLQNSVLQQVKELKQEIGILEGKILKIPPELLSPVSHELFDLLNKFRNLGECGSKSRGLLLENELVVWSGNQNTDLIEDDDDSFEPTLGDVGSWDQISGVTCKPEKWLTCNGFDAKTIHCQDSKVIKLIRNDETDTDTLVRLQVDNFYREP